MLWPFPFSSIYHLLCAWAYVSCQYETHVHFPTRQQKHAERRALFENGEMAVTLPTAALSGCGFGSLKCETDKSTSKYFLAVIENDNNIGHLSGRRHLPTVETHLCFLKGGRRETTGWEKKNRASTKAETSDNIQRG